MGVYVLLSQESVHQGSSVILDNELFSLETDENRPTVFAEDDISVADSVNLLLERRPGLFHPKEEDVSEHDDDIHANYFSTTEFQLPLNDENDDSSETTVPKKKRTTRQLRLASSSFHDSFGPLDLEDDPYPLDFESSGNFDHAEDTIDFPTFSCSEPEPSTTTALVPTAATCN